MLTKKFLGFVLLSTAAILLVVGIPSAEAKGKIMKKAAGAYLLELDASASVSAPPGSVILPVVGILHEDGTATSVDATDGGGGDGSTLQYRATGK